MGGGRKPTYEEAQRIVQLAKQGMTPREISDQMPFIDGRSISGYYRSGSVASDLNEKTKTLQELAQEEAGMNADAAAQANAAIEAGEDPEGQPGEEEEEKTSERNGTAQPPAANGQPSSPPPQATPQEPPADGSEGQPPAQEELPNPGGRAGFNPQGQRLQARPFTSIKGRTGINTGFNSAKGEHYLVEHLDGPSRGICGKEFPPFGPYELAMKYGPGTYQIRMFRGEIPTDRAIETVSQEMAAKFQKDGAVGGNGQPIAQQQSPLKTVSEVMTVMEQIETRIENRRNGEHNNSNKFDWGNGLATKALEGLIETAKNPPAAGQMQNFAELMREERKLAAEAHVKQMEALEKRHSQEMEQLRLKVEAEAKIRKAELDAQLERERNFLTQMTKLQDDARAQVQKNDEDRRKVYEDYMGRMLENADATRKAMEDERKAERDALRAERKAEEERLKARDESERKHTEEITKLMKEGGGGSLELEKQKTMWNGFGQIAQKLETGIGKIANAIQNQGKPVAEQEKQKTPEPSTAATSFDPKAALKEPWFEQLVGTVHCHIKDGKHGARMGNLYIDYINADKRYLAYYEMFLSVRTWAQVLDEIKDAIKPEYKDVLGSPKASEWYDQFKAYMELAIQKNLEAMGIVK